MKKNIWYISKYAVVPDDGTPTRQYFFSKHIAKKKYDVTLFSSKSSGIKNCKVKGIVREREIDGIKHVLINGPEITLGFSLKRILSWMIFETLLFISPLFLKPEKPDVIIVSSLSLLTVLTGFLFKKIYRAKLIFEIRDIWPLTLIELKNLSDRNPFVVFLKQIEKFGYKHADFIVGSMPELDKHIKATINKSFKFSCVPMGFDPDLYKTRTKIPKSLKQQLPKNKFIAGYAGSIGIANCISEIVEAAEKLEKTETNIFFAVLGEGALKQEFEERIENMKNIILLPKVPKEEVNDFLVSCDLLLNPWQDKKIYQYGVSPNKWIDYMFAEKPIIVCYNGYQSIINEAECGEFIPANKPELLADKILEYSKKDIVELMKIGKNGKNFLEKYMSYNLLTDKYIDIIESL